MKKILLILLLLIFLTVIGFLAFAFFVDVDQFRPQIVNRLESALGKPVQLKKISLGWHEGLALSLEGLAIAKSEHSPENLISIESAKTQVSLWPLLSRQLQVSTVYLEKPQIHLVKQQNGTIEGLQFDQKPSRSSQPAAALGFLIGAVKIDGGEVFFRDESGEKPKEIRMKDLDLKVENVSLDRPIQIDAKAALLSSSQNVHIRGTIKLALNKETSLSNVHAEIDLEAIEVKELAQWIPELAASGGRHRLQGQLMMDVDKLYLHDEGFKNIAAQIQLRDAALLLPSFKEPLEQININVLARAGEIKASHFQAALAGGSIQGQADVNLKTPKPLITVAAEFQKLSAERLLEAPADPSSPQLKGILSGMFKGTMLGTQRTEILQSMNGEGQINLNNGVVLNLNILRDVFRKLSMIPGILDKLRGRLPEGYEEKINARDTYLQNTQLPYVVKQGMLVMNQMNVQSDTFALQGGGSLGLVQNNLSAQLHLIVEPELSQALMRTIYELQALADQSGVLVIPLNVNGRLPQISVLPDLQYIASRIAVTKIGELFRKPETQAQDPSNPAPQPSPSGGLFSTLLGGGTSQTASDPSNPSASPAPSKKMPKGSAILGQLLQSALSPPAEDSSQTS